MFRSPHVRLLAADFPACLRFYRDTLGLTARFGATDEDVYEELEAGGQMFALYRRSLMADAVGAAGRPQEADAQDRAVLVLAVDSVDEATGRLRAQGVAPVMEPQDRPVWGVRTAHFRDPDGSLIEINSAL